MNTRNPRLILGSGSPRRRELLAQIGVTPDDIRAPEIDEDPRDNERPRDYCARVARDKAEAVLCQKGEIVLAADTTVALGRRILGKPADRSEARAFLEALSARRHKVITAVAVCTPDRLWLRDSVSTVRMRRLSAADIQSYLDSNDWRGKAGAYAIQGPAASFIPWISGSHSAIVGLPLAETVALLQAAGYDVRKAWG